MWTLGFFGSDVLQKFYRGFYTCQMSKRTESTVTWYQSAQWRYFGGKKVNKMSLLVDVADLHNSSHTSHILFSWPPEKSCDSLILHNFGAIFKQCWDTKWSRVLNKSCKYWWKHYIYVTRWGVFTRISRTPIWNSPSIYSVHNLIIG